MNQLRFKQGIFLRKIKRVYFEYVTLIYKSTVETTIFKPLNVNLLQ